jgi:phytoene dehydrogenase-like protein
MSKKIVIIGAGLAGLSAGCYARMNGFETEIYEMHDKPGGLCTAWQRRGYTIDYAIHDLTGANPDSALHFLWEELGALKDTPIHYHSEFWRVESPDGRQLPLYCDIEKFGTALKEISPEDSALIDEYLRDARKFGRTEFMAVVSGKLGAFLGMLPVLGAMKKWGGVSMADFASRFNSPLLQQTFAYLHYGWPHVPVMIHLAFLGMCHQNLFGFPEGGSLAFAENIAERFESLGGSLHYNARVEKILVENDRAVGIRLADGTEVRADVVISNGDGYTTIYEMLDGAYTSERIEAYYKAVPDEQEMNTTISLGVAREVPTYWRAMSYVLETPVEIAGEVRNTLDVEFYGEDQGFAPAGKTVLKILMKSRYGYWKALREDREAYRQAKEADIDSAVAILDARFPGLGEEVEMRDMATPFTVERYTGNIRGNQAWAPPDFSLMKMMQGLSRQLPGLKHFYMTGQWALGSLGIPNVAMDGRNVIKAICKADRRGFRTSKA